MNAPYQLLALGDLPLAPPALRLPKDEVPFLFTDASSYAAGYYINRGADRRPLVGTFVLL
jgi:hypothetical protein